MATPQETASEAVGSAWKIYGHQYDMWSTVQAHLTQMESITNHLKYEIQEYRDKFDQFDEVEEELTFLWHICQTHIEMETENE